MTISTKKYRMSDLQLIDLKQNSANSFCKHLINLLFIHFSALLEF